jgi:hypothetical protein
MNIGSVSSANETSEEISAPLLLNRGHGLQSNN